MHKENGTHGHRTVLADAAGIDDPMPRFRALIQHGWAPISPIGNPQRLVPALTYVAWSESDADKVRAAGARRVEAIGSPFLYLRRSRGFDEGTTAPRPGDGSMLVYPAHSWEREEMSGNHEQYIAEIRERAEGPVTVCLYWVDFLQPAIRHGYRDAGFHVVTHGVRYDPGFLWRQLDELLRHDIVASNHPSTALWYAGSLGRDIIRFGPGFSMSGEAFRRRWEEFQHRMWPRIDEQIVAGVAAVELAEHELGAPSMRDRDELRAILGPLDPRTRPWAARFERAAIWGEFTVRRTLSAARRSGRPGGLLPRNMQMMAEVLDAPEEPDDPDDPTDDG